MGEIPNIITHEEKINSAFEGTIIDIETIGEFSNYSDSRRYKDITPIIFGHITNKNLKILCAKNRDSIQLLIQKIEEILQTLNRPFHAFNCNFEKGVFFHSLNKEVLFEGELQKEKDEKGGHEPKRDAVSFLRIQQYGDPFNDDGKACMEAWSGGQIGKAIAHNRSCLLKERDILLKRGSREPDELTFVK